MCVCVCVCVRVLCVLTAVVCCLQGVGDDQSEKEKKQTEQRRWLQDLREWCVLECSAFCAGWSKVLQYLFALVCVEDQIQAKKTSRSLAVPPAGDVDNVGSLRSSGSTAGSPGEPRGGREEGGACLSAFWVCR